jgi:WhiB family redox-sensing transcriptional regulator
VGGVNFADGNCAGTDTEAFFPIETDREGTRVAKSICKGCPVASECLELAMGAESGTQRHGIYGGLTPRQRADLARRRAKESAA